MTMPTAICMSCGVLYLEWAPKYKPDQHCSRCGAPLKILPNTNRGGVAEVDRANKPREQNCVNTSAGTCGPR